MLMAFGLEILGKNSIGKGHPKNQLKLDPFLITSIFVRICVTYGRMQLTRAKRDASNPMHLRSTETRNIGMERACVGNWRGWMK